MPWRLLYSFTENESLPIDAENASFVASTKPEGIFWNNVLCVKHALLDSIDELDEEGKAQAALERGQYPAEVSRNFMFRYIMMGREVKRVIGRSSVTIRTLETELERIEALRDIFGLDIPVEARFHIAGRNSALES